MSGRRGDADDAGRLARRAAGGDLEAAKRLVATLSAKSGNPLSILPDDVVGLALEALSATRLLLEDFERDNEGGYLFWQPGGRGHEVLSLAKLASITLENPGLDWRHRARRIRALAVRKTCRFCGQPIFDMREESGSQEADWATEDGDFGCPDSPDTVNGEDAADGGVGDHEPDPALA